MREQLRQHFRPEFLNRVDDIIVFRQLSREDIGRIVELQLARLTKLLAERRHRARRDTRRRGTCSPQRGTTRSTAPARSSG